MAILYNTTPPAEEWRAIPNFPSYQVSNLGRVRSLKFRPMRIIKAWQNKGYFTVGLRAKGRTVQRRVHQLVLEAFVGARPEGMEGCHNNSERDDNRLENLRWDTHKNNLQDRNEQGTRSTSGLLRGLTTAQRLFPCIGTKLTEREVKEIRAKWIPRKYSMPKLAIEYGVHRSMIQSIVERRSWAWVK